MLPSPLIVGDVGVAVPECHALEARDPRVVGGERPDVDVARVVVVGPASRFVALVSNAIVVPSAEIAGELELAVARRTSGEPSTRLTRSVSSPWKLR